MVEMNRFLLSCISRSVSVLLVDKLSLISALKMMICGTQFVIVQLFQRRVLCQRNGHDITSCFEKDDIP
jgi:hypothetical protein